MNFGENAKTHQFEAVTVLGNPMLFTSAHLDHSTIPRGVHLYAVRHHSEDCERPVQICSWAVVNRYGSLLSSTPIPLKHHPKLDNSFKDIDPNRDWERAGYSVHLRDYLENYPVQKPRRVDHER